MRLLFYFIVLSIAIYGCGGQNKPSSQSSSSPDLIEPDSNLLFNGRNLDGWEITNFGPQGPVYISGDAIILGMGDGCTGITWKGFFPVDRYKVTLEAKRISGNDFFCGITFPVGAEPCSFIVGGWGGVVVGLSSIDGNDASENETTLLKKFDNNRWYSVSLTVNGDTIKAEIDDEVMVSFIKGKKRLSIRPEVELSRPFGITSWSTKAAIRNIRLEMI